MRPHLAGEDKRVKASSTPVTSVFTGMPSALTLRLRGCDLHVFGDLQGPPEPPEPVSAEAGAVIGQRDLDEGLS